ncbi:calcium-binding protein [Mesorhizobium sp. ASY16-5R]|uniref:calcium-binding protein n=1 Tax=Mesorhizobium sp. ASY16-5R TaxID=3445772 RepID=UPI003FA06157
MIVSQFVDGVSAEFSLVRSGNQLTATFHYDLTGFEDDEGIFLWDGEIGASIGAYSDYFQQTFDRPMDLQFVATLTPGANTMASYFVNDNIGGASFDREFNVVLFNTAANFVGTSVADLVFGSSAADSFRSVGAGDVFEGGAGNDIYAIYSADTQVVEAAGGGTDRVGAAVSYVLTAGAEVELLTTTNMAGTSKINLTGNELAQKIYGNAGDNLLDGNGGTDTLIGGQGNDIYFVDSAADVIVDNAGEGTDLVVARGVDYVLGAAAQVEHLRTSSASSTAGIDLTGNDFAQIIRGNAGDNVLVGRGGNDKLYGLDGADTFLFDSAFDSSNRDAIYDFGLGDDQIQLDSAVFTALGTGGLAASAFKDIAVAPLDASDRIIYNSDNGKLYYDPDGSGGTDMILFAAVFNQFRNPASITAADFSII